MASNLFVGVNARRDCPTEVAVPIITTFGCTWDKGNRVLVFQGARFPTMIDVVSDHTGVVLRFVQDNEAAERNEWWDGELYEYKCDESDIRLIVEKG